MKAYIVLYACSLTRVVYLELLPDQTTKEFLRSLKRFIARRGRPEKIFSDNGKTFVAASKWFERLIGVIKQSMYKAIGNGNLRWHELDEVI